MGHHHLNSFLLILFWTQIYFAKSSHGPDRTPVWAPFGPRVTCLPRRLGTEDDIRLRSRQSVQETNTSEADRGNQFDHFEVIWKKICQHSDGNVTC